ncbi:MAG: ABC transporter ATP-binding protein [Cyclobacteriaceae bacterium]|nr:ABC transporter ATP-binding protein [Cyclobacteriaceae bacterium]MDW8332451.1 ABC transporter ATP-binding protein [Cyclobacteriaceae bacterium]
MISVHQLKKNFARLEVLRGITVAFEPRKTYALIGPNGSGKTTFIKCMLGMVLPTSGKILIDGEDVRNHWRYREKTGYMPQIGRYPDNMRMGQLFDMMRNIRKGAAHTDEELIDAFGLRQFFDKRMHTLSGGTRQKVSAALAFLFNPPILFLDEPTAGLDPISVEILKEKILHERLKGKLLIITSHIMNDLDELATEAVLIQDGVVRFSGTIGLLKEQTGENRLGKAIARFMSHGFPVSHPQQP